MVGQAGDDGRWDERLFADGHLGLVTTCESVHSRPQQTTHPPSQPADRMSARPPVRPTAHRFTQPDLRLPSGRAVRSVSRRRPGSKDLS